MKLSKALVCLVLTGCGQGTYQREHGGLDPKAPEGVAHLHHQDDSARFPHWLSVLYPSEVSSKNQVLGQRLVNFREMNDSVAYCIYEQLDGVCSRQFLATYVRRERRDSLEIGHICDHDQSVPTYTWKEFGVHEPHRIWTNEYKESVADSLINEQGFMKEGHDHLNVGRRVDTLRREFQIDPRGRVLEVHEETPR